jgi:hypothetical protein
MTTKLAHAWLSSLAIPLLLHAAPPPSTSPAALRGVDDRADAVLRQMGKALGESLPPNGNLSYIYPPKAPGPSSPTGPLALPAGAPPAVGSLRYNSPLGTGTPWSAPLSSAVPAQTPASWMAPSSSLSFSPTGLSPSASLSSGLSSGMGGMGSLRYAGM